MADKTYSFVGRVTLDGVVFFIDAPSKTAALEAVRSGKFDEYEVAGAETVDWTIQPHTIREE